MLQECCEGADVGDAILLTNGPRLDLAGSLEKERELCKLAAGLPKAEYLECQLIT